MEAISRCGVAIDRALSAAASGAGPSSPLGDARDRRGDLLHPAVRLHVAASARQLPALAHSLSLVLGAA
jgi:hypothetical protein